LGIQCRRAFGVEQPAEYAQHAAIPPGADARGVNRVLAATQRDVTAHDRVRLRVEILADQSAHAGRVARLPRVGVDRAGQLGTARRGLRTTLDEPARHLVEQPFVSGHESDLYLTSPLRQTGS